MSKISFMDLLKAKTHFIVPTIQRDYAQGRNEGSDKDLCEEVRSDIVENLYNALTSVNQTELVLDYVYGSDENNVFYPIDGQQRLTTLFLLYWYLGKKEEINIHNPNDFDLLKKFTYEIRDTSKEFCQSLIEIKIDFSLSDTISIQIKNSSKYHGSFDFDPTVNAMLVMLDKIDETFRNQTIPMWNNLNRIKFWVLSLQQFGLTDDLFVKMNARGKRLSRFDVFKSDLESALSKGNYSDTSIIDLWKKEIDNTYLDKYWAEYGSINSERNLFRTILFFLKALQSVKDCTKKYDESWEINESTVNYKEEIKSIKNDLGMLGKICCLLSNFDSWKARLINTHLFIDSNNEISNIPGYLKAKIFGVLYWFSYSNNMNYDTTFEQFERILDNYIYSLRQYNIKPRNYSSSIDNTITNSSFIGKVFLFIKELIDGYSNRTIDFNTYIINTNYPELSYEREKLQSTSFCNIVDIENISYIKGNTHNLFFNGVLYLDAAIIQTIFSDEELTSKFIRIIISYSADEYGKFQNLLMDEITNQSGRKQLHYNNADDKATAYFHKIVFNPNAKFGDNILTAKGTGQSVEISKCVQSCVKEISNLINTNGLTVRDAIEQLLTNRLTGLNFTDSKNIKWYLVKYKEFFHDMISTSLSVLKRKDYNTGIDNNNIYDIQCVGINDNDFVQSHYQPFYLALCHLLINNRARITIDENSLKYTGVEIEFAHPCTLSNGWIIRIDENGNWIIRFAGVIPTSTFANFSVDVSGVGYLDCTGYDSIEKMAEFLGSI